MTPRPAAARGVITVTPSALGGNWQLSPQGTDDVFLVALVRADVDENHYCVNAESGTRCRVLTRRLESYDHCLRPSRLVRFCWPGFRRSPSHQLPANARHSLPWDPNHIVPYAPVADPGVTVTGPNAELTGPRDNISSWAKGGGCSPDKSVRDIGSDIVLWTYRGCASGIDVELYTFSTPTIVARFSIVIAPTTNTISATELMLDFFEAHPMRPHRS